jgi:hypothetical protein
MPNIVYQSNNAHAPERPNMPKRNNKGHTGKTPHAAKRCKACGYSQCRCRS